MKKSESDDVDVSIGLSSAFELGTTDSQGTKDCHGPHLKIDRYLPHFSRYLGFLPKRHFKGVARITRSLGMLEFNTTYRHWEALGFRIRSEFKL